MKRLSVILLILLAGSVFAQNEPPAKQAKISWLQTFDFKPAAFKDPAIQFRPFARWWWPGNFVTSAELKREINLFADHHFGGVELQTLSFFIPGGADVRAKVNSWDSPDYYQHVIEVMNEAKKRGMTIDMTDGSGWPPGGSHLASDDGFLTLDFASVDADGAKNISIPLSKVINTSVGHALLQAVVAAKIIPKSVNDKTNTVNLDSTSVTLLTAFVSRDTLTWDAPSGKWKIIVFWSKPQGQTTMSSAPKQGPVMNHFDSTAVLKNYRYLFGRRTALTPFFGNPMRAVFDDSFEFAVERHYSLGFLDFFKKHRGYDISKWLPAEMQHNYNFVSFRKHKSDDDFSFSDQDWRLKYDYDLTLSELLNEQFMDAAKNWLEPQGLLHRTQGYGLPLDMIAVAGHASIPETESMLGQEANLKIMTSGGHLYHKPVISAESVVFNGRAYTTTPQKTKIAVDKLFAAGVNQIIYHGIPYRLTAKELGPEGWYPFSTPMTAFANFSSNLGESYLFWNDQKAVNDYVTRTQYALRSGKALADVLIYFPYMDVDGMPNNPEEILADGSLKDIEGPLPPSHEIPNTRKVKWAAIVYPLINTLEANGITWDWTNDESLQAAQITPDRMINIRGNIYQAIILPETPVIQVKTALAIKTLASGGVKFVSLGTLPDKQPSYLNWQENDQITAKALQDASTGKSNKSVKSKEEIIQWISTLDRPIKFAGQYNFIREAKREMNDGSRIQFIWNKSDEWQTVSLILDKKYKSNYWLNADLGNIDRNAGNKINYRLAPYASVILYASTKPGLPLSIGNIKTERAGDSSEIVAKLATWKLKTDSLRLDNIDLFDWRSNSKLKFSSDQGDYTASIFWKSKSPNSRYVLDLGHVYFTAEVFVNGKSAGRRIFAPYTYDITQLLCKGQNTVQVKVFTGQLNGMIGKAGSGDARYKQFKGKEDQVMAAGLVGPVMIRKSVKK